MTAAMELNMNPEGRMEEKADVEGGKNLEGLT